MNIILISCIVTFLFIVVQIIVGTSLERSGKPYKVFQLVVHIVLSLAILAGVASINIKFQGTTPIKLFPVISMGVAGIFFWISIITGIILAVIKKVNKGLVVVHKISQILITIPIVVNAVLLILKI